MGLNELQQKAFDMALNNQIFILTGPPGTGKTFTLKAIVENLIEQGKSFYMAAPTGRAAKQMHTATGYPASTIHKLLDPKPRTDPVTGNVKFGFGHNKDNPIMTDVLIIDECSMINNNLMYSVLDAITPGTKLIFVGDKGQLPSIGAGAILRDMIESNIIPTVELTEIQRNSGDIVKACHNINKGRFYDSSPELKLEDGLNLKHVESSSTLIMQNIIKTIICDRMPNRGFNPIWDCQVISPTNSRTDLSCDSLNQILQDRLNQNSIIEGSKFRVSDKVIQTKNENVNTPTGSEVYVVNGDIGKVLNIEGNSMVVQFFLPDRICAIPLKKNHLLLAYAITCHRFQGSQAPVVVIPVHSAFGFFLDRAWIYTALSRAEQICITVGEFQAIRTAITKNNSHNRVTKLKQLLEG